LHQSLQKHFPDTKFDLFNLAAGATTTMSALPSLIQWLKHEELTPGIILLDFGVNDGLEADIDALPAAMEKLLLTVRRVRPDLLPIYVSSCGNIRCASSRDLMKRVAMWHEIPLVAFFPDFVDSLKTFI
jgi:hypothetical protein